MKTEDVKDAARPYTNDPRTWPRGGVLVTKVDKRKRSQSGDTRRDTRRQKIGEPIVEREMINTKGNKRMAPSSTFGEKDKKTPRRENVQRSLERAPVKGRSSVSGRSATPRRLNYTPSPGQGRVEERSFRSNPERVGSSSSDDKRHVNQPPTGPLTKEDEDNFAKQLFAQMDPFIGSGQGSQLPSVVGTTTRSSSEFLQGFLAG